MQYFTLSNLEFFKNLIFYFRKLKERWYENFIINNFSRNHGTLHILKILDREPAPNTHYDNYLRIFCLQEKYLQPTDEKALVVLRNLRFRRRKLR